MGVDDQGNELGRYYRSDGNYTTMISQEEALSAVENSKGSQYTTVACTYSTTDMQNSVMQEGSSGIHIKPGTHEGTPTLVSVAATVNAEGTGSGDSGTNYLRVTAPCPNQCGDGYLTQLGE